MVAINGIDEVLDQLRVTADRRQLPRLLAFAERWPDRVWAVENASGLGRLLSRQLLDAGLERVEMFRRKGHDAVEIVKDVLQVEHLGPVVGVHGTGLSAVAGRAACGSAR